VLAAKRRAIERSRAAHAAELAGLRRVLVHAFPADAAAAVVLVDVAERALNTYLADEFSAARERLAAYDLIGAQNVRAVLQGLNFDPGGRRLAELGPPQKSKKLNKRGRTLKITTSMLIQGSCGIARPFGDGQKLREYLLRGQTERLRRRLEADAKALFALYEYGRLHRAVRLRWGFLDEMIPAPWVQHDEPSLYELKRQADADGEIVEVVTDRAPGWTDPWARAKRCRVEPDHHGYHLYLVDEIGWVVDDGAVQLARLAGPR
jgi:hypothetical protein